MKGGFRTAAFFYEEISDEAFTSYIRRITSLPLLSKEEELILAERIQKGDERAVRKLVESNLRFVVKVARSGIEAAGFPSWISSTKGISDLWRQLDGILPGSG